jgi:predicted NBD/HSP70 family sugar kinase
MRDGERGAGSATMRSHNMALILRLIAEEGPVSRVELAGRTGLTKATVSSLVTELADAVLVQDIGPAGTVSTGGRPATLLAPSLLGPMAVGLQIDVDHVAGCLVDLGGRVRAREIRRGHTLGLAPRELVHGLRRMLGRLLAAAVDAGRLVAGVGVALPAVVATERADDPVVTWAPPFGWRDVDLRGLVVAELAAMGAADIPVNVGNDAALAARAEFRAGRLAAGHAGGESRRLATSVAGYGGSETGRVVAGYVGGESEIGAAVLVDGVVRSGGHIGGSGFGHVPLRPRGERCVCGARGCLDRYAGLAVLGARPTARAVAGAADALGEALGPLVAALDPDLMVIGGRLGALGDGLLEPLRRRLDTFVPGLAPRTQVRAGTLGPDAAMRGAALAIVERIVADPLAWITEMAA